MKAPSTVKKAFEADVQVLPLSSIIAPRPIDAALRRMPKYKRIVASIPHVGLVEPLVVVRSDNGAFRLLDGHLRLAALLDLGMEEARCLIALDDEAFTYNKRISHLVAIQEHYMILKALARSTSEQRIAYALNLDVAAIKLRRNMLDGVCAEVVDLLKSKTVNIGVFSSLRRMKPIRQIEATELMLAAANLTASYAKVLLAGTRPSDLARPTERKHVGGLSPKQMAQMQREMESVQADFKAVEKTFGDTMLQLVVATGYIGSLIRNAEIWSFMDTNYPEIVTQFKSIVQAASLEAT